MQYDYYLFNSLSKGVKFSFLFLLMSRPKSKFFSASAHYSAFILIIFCLSHRELVEFLRQDYLSLNLHQTSYNLTTALPGPP